MNYRGKEHNWLMNRQEQARGWVFFALFVLVFPLLMGLIQRSMEGEPPIAEANVIYYLLSVTLVLLLFWSYLRNSFNALLDRLPENLLALVTGLAGALALGRLVMLLPYPVENPNPLDYAEQFQLSPAATVVILIALMPVVEEVLFRGLLLGSIRPYSRPLAWCVSVLGYSVYCVWQFVFSFGRVEPRYLLLFAQYLPLSLGATWCCDRGGSVWSAIGLHMVLNGLTLWAAVA